MRRRDNLSARVSETSSLGVKSSVLKLFLLIAVILSAGLE